MELALLGAVIEGDIFEVETRSPNNKYINLALEKALYDGKYKISLILAKNNAELTLSNFKLLGSGFQKEGVEKIVSICSKKIPDETIIYILSLKKYCYLFKYLEKSDIFRLINNVSERNYQFLVENNLLTSDQIWEYCYPKISNVFQTQNIIDIDNLQSIFNNYPLNSKNQREFRTLFGNIPPRKTVEQFWIEYCEAPNVRIKESTLFQASLEGEEIFKGMLIQGAEITLNLIEMIVESHGSHLFAQLSEFGKIPENLILERLEQCSNKMSSGHLAYFLT